MSENDRMPRRGTIWRNKTHEFMVLGECRMPMEGDEPAVRYRRINDPAREWVLPVYIWHEEFREVTP